jgi:hypothetical protein
MTLLYATVRWKRVRRLKIEIKAVSNIFTSDEKERERKTKNRMIIFTKRKKKRNENEYSD